MRTCFACPVQKSLKSFGDFLHALALAYFLYHRHLEIFRYLFKGYIHKRVESFPACCALELAFEAEHLRYRELALYHSRAHLRLHVHYLAAPVLNLVHCVAHQLIRHVYAYRLHGLQQRWHCSHYSFLYRICDGRQHLCRTAVYRVLVQLRIQNAYFHPRARLAANRPVLHDILERLYYQFHCLVQVLYALCPVYKSIPFKQVLQTFRFVPIHPAFKKRRHSVLYEFSYVFLFELAVCYRIINTLLKRLDRYIETIVFVRRLALDLRTLYLYGFSINYNRRRERDFDVFLF